jgi:hypothetical protein
VTIPFGKSIPRLVSFPAPLDNVKYMMTIILLMDEDVRLVEQSLSYWWGELQ